MALSGLGLLTAAGSGRAASEQLSYFGGSVFFVASNDIGFGKALESQFVNLDVGPEGDETHEAVLGE